MPAAEPAIEAQGPGVAAPGPVDPYRTAGRAVAWLAKQVEVSLASVELSIAQYRVLGYLDLSPAVSSDLAERLAVRPPSITAVMDGLVARGLVERQPVKSDRRLVRHVLTDQGHQVLDAADRATSARIGEIASCLDTEERSRRLLDGLALWRQALGAFRLRRQEQARAQGQPGCDPAGRAR